MDNTTTLEVADIPESPVVSGVITIEHTKDRSEISPLKKSPAQQVRECIEELNDRYYHIVVDGQNQVLRMIPADIGTGLKVEIFKLAEFKALWSHDDQVLVRYKSDGETPEYLPKGVVWLNHKDANFIDGSLDFDPLCPPLTITPRNRLNIWQGNGVNPTSCTATDKQVSLYLDHMLGVICNGNKRNFKYLLGYIAHLIQKPWEKPSVAVVMKAGQGSGKGTFLNPLLSITGGHGFATINSKDVVGNFNSALESRTLVFFDEAFAGSKEASDMLKGLISERYTRIERKGVNACFVPNKMRIFMASNHDNIVSIEVDDRRYLFLKVSESVKQDRAYFSERAFMHPEHSDHMRFASKLLGYLQSVDISDFDPHQAPVTDELTQQKIDCLSPERKWVYHVLQNGTLHEDTPWPNWLHNDDCYRYCREWMDLNRMKASFGEASRKIGKALTEIGLISKTERFTGGSPIRARSFIPLDEARKNFESVIKGKIDW